MGHDLTVSARFYLKVTEDLYERVAGVPANPSAAGAPQNAPQTPNGA